MPIPRPLVDRFYDKISPVPFSGCWLWTGSGMAKGGYGKITVEQGDQTGTGAHRVSWMLHRGEIPAGMWVLHRCDVPACVNPEHLFLGSAKDNNIDSYAKGRSVPPGQHFVGPPCPRWLRKRLKRGGLKGRPPQKGEMNWNARLNWKKVEDIRTGRLSKAEFARLYGVSPKTIKNVQNGVAWPE